MSRQPGIRFFHRLALRVANRISPRLGRKWQALRLEALGVEVLEQRLALATLIGAGTSADLRLSGSYAQVSKNWFWGSPKPAVMTSSSISMSASLPMFGSTTTSTASSTWVVRLSSQALTGVSTLADATRLIDPAGNGLQILSGLGLPGLMLVQGTNAASNLQSYLAGNRALAYFQADQKVTTNSVFPNDPNFGRLYGLNNVSQTGGMFDADIDAPEAWDISTGSRNTVVSVIDTGVDLAHRDLYQNIWINQGEIPQEIRSRVNDSDRDGRFTFIDLNAPTNASFVFDGNRNGYIDALDLLADTRWANGTDNEGDGFVDDLFGWDFVNNDNNPMDDQSHGTHVAGTIGASGGNGVGVVGVNWQVSIMPLKFLSATGGGSMADAIRAVNYATMMRSQYDPGIRVSSNSWGGGSYSQALLDSIDAGGAAGVLFVAAAGNSAANSDTTPAYPAAYASSAILSVASTDSSDRLSSFSNYGATSVDVGAPGSSIYSTVPGGYDTKSGTSMATPQVSGAAALALAVNPGLSVAQLKQAILRTADPVASLAGKIMSGGRVNAFRLLQAVGPVAPSLVLSSTSIGENSAVGTEVGVLTVSTVTGGTAYVYSLVGGAGGVDNSAFIVRDNRLLTNATFDFEAKSAFSIRLRAVAAGVAVERSFTIQVTDMNEAPTGVLLSNVLQSIPQNAGTASRTKVADIRVQDDALGQNTLALTGNDASSFEIVGSSLFLRAGVVLDRTARPTYSVMVVAFDTTLPGSVASSMSYTLTVTTPVNSAPTGLVLSNATVAENRLASTTVGTLSTIDPDSGDRFSYTLVSGSGDTDNTSFSIVGNELRTQRSFDFEARGSLSIRLRTTDGRGLSLDRSFTIRVADMNEAPTGVLLSNVLQSIPQNAGTASRTKVADIRVQDDALGQNTLALTGNDASSFEIVGSSLFLRAGVVLDRTARPTYSVMVVAFDTTLPGSVAAGMSYTLTVTAPTSAGTTLVFQGQNFHFKGGSANYIWQAGDYWRQSFTVPSVATVTQLALQLQMTSNSTSRAGLDMGVFVNSIRVGQFSLTVGTSGTQNYSYSFAAIAGPTYQIELRALNTVPAGQGAVSLVTASGNSFARIGANADVGQTSVATLSRIPGEGYARLVQSGIALQQGQTYRFTMRMAGSVQLGGTDHMPEFWGEGLIFGAFDGKSYERDGWTYYQATVTTQKTGIYELKLALWSRQSLNVTDISLKSLSTGAESVRNGSFVDGLSGWYSQGGRIGRAVH